MYQTVEYNRKRLRSIDRDREKLEYNNSSSSGGGRKYPSSNYHNNHHNKESSSSSYFYYHHNHASNSSSLNNYASNNNSNYYNNNRTTLFTSSSYCNNMNHNNNNHSNNYNYNSQRYYHSSRDDYSNTGKYEYSYSSSISSSYHHDNNNNYYDDDNDNNNHRSTRYYKYDDKHYYKDDHYKYSNNSNSNNNSRYNYNQDMRLTAMKQTQATWDDENNYYKAQIGEYLNDRYKVVKVVGTGTFSTVVECLDYESDIYVAIKIVRSVKKYSEDAMVEIDILDALERNGVNQKYHCIRLLNWFKHKDHVCLVFRRYGLSLYDFLKKNRNRPFPLSHIQSISKQLITAIYTMHKLSLIHTDLKPENILLENSNYSIFNRTLPTQLKRQQHSFNSIYNNYNHNNDNIINNNNNTFKNNNYNQKQQSQYFNSSSNSNSNSNSSNSSNNNSSSGINYKDHRQNDVTNMNNHHDHINQTHRVMEDEEYFHLEQTDIVVIDFGGATFDDRHHTSVVCSRPYRPPEIILGNGWSYPCDMWGIGCILVELYTGITLFDTHSNRQHLAMMERVIGPLPQHLTHNSKKYYPTGDYLDWEKDKEDLKSFEKVNSLRGLNEYFHPDHKKLLDLISKLLEYQPSKRLSAYEALNHPFFLEKIDNDLYYL